MKFSHAAVILLCLMSQGFSTQNHKDAELKRTENNYFHDSETGQFIDDIVPWMIPRSNTGGQHKRLTPKDPQSAWSHGVIPYIFNGQFTVEEQTRVTDMMRIMEQQTMVNGQNCIQFRPRSQNEAYLEINRPETGRCNSQIGSPEGWQGVNKNVMNLPRLGCINDKKTIIHELFHAVGFWHEHNRPDRDYYIIMPDNIQDPEMKWKWPWNNVDVCFAYDYESVSHYDGLKSKDPSVTCVGQHCSGKGLSPTDIKKIQVKYGCITKPQCTAGVNFPPPDFSNKVAPTISTTCFDQFPNCDAFWCDDRDPSTRKQGCAKTCGFCKGTTGTGVTTGGGTDTGTATSTSTCRDTSDFGCLSFKSFYCNPAAPDAVKTACAKTCGYCKEETCVDTGEFDCVTYKTFFCVPSAPDKVKKGCAKTCGYCGSTGITTGTGTGSGVITAPCVDKNPNCKVNPSWCTDTKMNFNWLKQDCAQTCDMCLSGVSTCKDNSPICQPSVCVIGQDINWLKQNCADTCQFCTADELKKVGCEDRVICGFSICTDVNYSPAWLQQNCRKTCRLC